MWIGKKSDKHFVSVAALFADFKSELNNKQQRLEIERSARKLLKVREKIRRFRWEFGLLIFRLPGAKIICHFGFRTLSLSHLNLEFPLPKDKSTFFLTGNVLHTRYHLISSTFALDCGLTR